MLTKDTILNHCSKLDIYLKFLNLTEIPNSNISSPFAKDNNPSFKVYKNGTFKCHSSGKQGDVFQFVADIENLDCKTQFNDVLKQIALKMNLETQATSVTSAVQTKTIQKGSDTSINSVSNDLQTPIKNGLQSANKLTEINSVPTKSSNKLNDSSINDGLQSPNSDGLQTPIQDSLQTVNNLTEVKSETTKNSIESKDNTINDGLQSPTNEFKKDIANHQEKKTLSVTKRKFTNEDLIFWRDLGIEEDILKKYNVNSISNYTWSGKKPIYTKKEAVAFAIELDEQIKLYIPNQPEIGIKKNVLPAYKSGIYGLEQLGTEKKEIVIICAGEKDTISANSRGFNSVTFGSESSHPNSEQIKQIQEHCNIVFVCYDNDEAGEKGKNNLIKRFPFIVPLQLPQNEKIKGYDITDYFQEHSAEDFQKIIDLAVKNKTELELKNKAAIITENIYSEYELPKEIHEPISNFISDIKKYKLFIANNKIWVLKETSKKKYFKEISNFEIQVLQHLPDEKVSMKLIRIKNEHNKEVVFDTLSDRLNSVSKLDETVTSFGNFLFLGTTPELNLLRAYLFDNMGIGKKIECLGFQEEFNFWVWNNKVNLMNGNVLEIDMNGMFKFNENSFYIPSSNSIYKFNNSKYINQKKFKVFKSESSTEDYLKLWFRVYKEHAITSILFTLSSIFQDIVVNETKSFPILFLQGGTSSGKDNLAFCCQSFLGTPQDKISIGAGVSTQKAQIRELAQFTNGISQFSEYKTGDKSTDEILKGIWDRNGYKMGTIESKISTDVVPISSSLIVTSNYTPIDEALITRLLWVNIEKNTFSTEENNLYEQLKNVTYSGISSFTDELLHYRNDFKDCFKKDYVKNKELFSNAFGNLPIRVASNYAVLKSVFDFFEPIIGFPFNANELTYHFNKSALYIGDKIKSSSITVRWWDCFYECLKSGFENKIEFDRDFKINGSEITFNYSVIYSKIQRQWYNQFKENIPNKDTMKNAIENSIAFTEKKKSDRVNKQVTSTITFDTSLLENSEILTEHFNYLLNTSPK